MLIVSSMDLSSKNHDEDTFSWKPVPYAAGIYPTLKEAKNSALVLDSRIIPCCIEPFGNGWRLLVPEQQVESAIRELALYEEANKGWPPPIPVSRQLFENSLPTVSILLLLALFHNMTLLGISIPGVGSVDFNKLGAAHSQEIMDGKLWQCITALTLHTDLSHLLSNLLIGGAFILFLCREIGSGPAWTLLLFSGFLGNFLNAWLQSPDHRSVGASTAVFGAVGILTAISTLRYRHTVRKRWFVPVAAGFAILALLGTEGKNTDLGAHLTGFASGLLSGLSAEYIINRFGRPGGVLNIMLAFFSWALVLSAWWAAVKFG
ncbi:MAG: rhomboid family intramembrane serine protease [Desulfuromonadaceae bacterium]|nr:rhomboid family intramembrane serine protease [Desulfuromonadaceae bacterium]MDD2854520.1 rhomboid family intramembrane serine protease [Desulfuromonadaceae bacterium]